ncbi:MAG: hypothetical protein KI791_03390 [Cyclobacteriaceae bacterium]|nr:hypothetical protein [Cyclobacteriaceae bacterium SS2]
MNSKVKNLYGALLKWTICVFGILLILLTNSCQTYRSLVPTIEGAPRHDLDLENPIMIAFKDSRQQTENSLEMIESLKAGLKTIYGQNIAFQSYFDKTEENHVALKINIKEISSQFGIRTIEYQTYHNQITAISSSVSTYWGSAVSTAIVSQPVVRNNYAAQGYWVGTSYLEIALVDNIHSVKNIYEFPFAAEDMQSNMWGYKSGNTAAQNSWGKVSSHLLDLIDSIALKIIENE